MSIGENRQTSNPVFSQGPHLQHVLRDARDLSAPQMDAGPNRQQMLGRDMQEAAIGRYDDRIRDLYSGVGGFMDQSRNINRNPYLEAAAQGSADLTIRNLQERILPNLMSDMNSVGAAGGSRHGIAEGIAARGAAEEIARQTAGMYGDAFNQGQQNYLNAAAMQPGIAERMMMPGQMMEQIGDRRQQDPWDILNQYANIVYGAPTGQQTSGSSYNVGTESDIEWPF